MHGLDVTIPNTVFVFTKCSAQLNSVSIGQTTKRLLLEMIPGSYFWNILQSNSRKWPWHNKLCQKHPSGSHCWKLPCGIWYDSQNNYDRVNLEMAVLQRSLNMAVERWILAEISGVWYTYAILLMLWISAEYRGIGFNFFKEELFLLLSGLSKFFGIPLVPGLV